MKSIDTRRALGLILMGTGLLVAAFCLSGQLNRSAQGAPTPQPNYGPLVPTSIGQTPPGRSTLPGAALPAARKTPPAAPSIGQSLYVPRQRVGVGVGVPFPKQAAKSLNELRPGWYLDWQAGFPVSPGTIEYAQMVRVPRGEIVPDLKTIAQIAQQNPGALWLIGNEMDVIWQDNATPEQYAAAYHDVYATLKQADPSSRVAIGGVSEPSPLRLHYLDRVLQAYRETYGQDMPIDVWNVHNFILPEQRGSWGVDIPPGIAATQRPAPIPSTITTI